MSITTFHKHPVLLRWWCFPTLRKLGIALFWFDHGSNLGSHFKLPVHNSKAYSSLAIKIMEVYVEMECPEIKAVWNTLAIPDALRDRSHGDIDTQPKVDISWVKNKVGCIKPLIPMSNHTKQQLKCQRLSSFSRE